MAGSIGISFLIGATLGSSVGAAFSSLQDRIRATQQSFRTASRQSRQMSDALAARQRRDAAAEAARQQMRATGRVDDSTRRELQRLNQEYARAARAAGVYGQSVDEITRRQRELARSVETTGERLRRMQALQGQRDLRSEIVSQMKSTFAPAAAVAMPVKLAIDFESAMADVKKVTDFDAPGFEKFSGDILELSTRLPMAADGLAAIAAAAGQSGIAQEELLTFTEDAAKMGVAFDISAEKAGSAMTGLRNNFKLTQDEVRLLGDSMNALANSMDAKAADIVNFANRAGGTAKVYGFTGQEVAALGAAFLDCKVGAEEASTATNSMLTKLGTASILPDRAKDAIKSLGLSAKGLERAFKDDAQGALLSFLQTVKKSKDPMMALSEIFGAEHAPKIVRLMNNLDHYQNALKTVSDKDKYAGSMQNEYAVRAKTTANNIQLLKNTVNRLGITVGSVLLPPLNQALGFLGPMVTGVADFAKKNEWLTQSVALAAGGFVAFRIGALVFRYVASAATSAGIRIGGAFAGARRALAIPWPFARIRNGLQSIGRNAASAVRRMRQLGPAGMMAAAGAGGIRILGAAGRMAAGGIRTLGTAFKMAFGPVGLLMTALSFGVDYLIENWDKVGPYFTALWDGVKNVFTSVLGWMQPLFDKIGGWIDKIGSGLGKVKSFVGGLWNKVTGKDEDKKEEKTAADGAPKPATTAAPESAAKAAPETVAKTAPKPAAKNTPESVAKTNPEPAAKTALEPAATAAPKSKKDFMAQVRERHAESMSKTDQETEDPAKPTSEQIAERARKIRASRNPREFEFLTPEQEAEMQLEDELEQKKTQKPAPKAAPQAQPAAPAQGPTAGPQVNVSVNVTQNGVPDQTFAQGVVNAIRNEGQSAIEEIINRIVGDQARLAYGG